MLGRLRVSAATGRLVRCLHSSAFVLQKAVPAAPTLQPNLDLPVRGFIDNDPMPDRPPEDDIATCTAYFEALASMYYSAPEKAVEVTNRVSRLMDPRNWVNAVNIFSVHRIRCPEVTKLVESRFLAAPAASFAALDAHYLSSLAFAMYAQGLPGDAAAPASKAFWEGVAARAGEVGAFPASMHANLKTAIEGSGQGVALPANVKAVEETVPTA